MATFTSRALIEALFKLLDKKPLSKIKVTDVTAECGVNRMTFYYHFENIDDLIEKAFEYRFFSELDKEINDDNWREAYYGILHVVYEKRDFVNKVYPEFDTHDLISFLDEHATNFVTRATQERTAHLCELDRQTIIGFFRSTIVGGFLSWIKSGCQTHPDEMLSRFDLVFDSTLSALVERMSN